MDISLIPALVFGIEGNYNFLGIPVEILDSSLNRITRAFIGATGIHINTFIHEVGHAVATSYVYGRYGKITIDSSVGGWATRPSHPLRSPVTSQQQVMIYFAGPLADLVHANIKSFLTLKLIKWMKNRRERKILNCYEKALVRLLNLQTLFNLFLANFVLLELLYKISRGFSITSPADDFERIHQHGGFSTLMKSAVIVWSFTASSLVLIHKQSYTSKEKIQPLYVRIYLYVHIKLSQTSVLMRSSLFF